MKHRIRLATALICLSCLLLPVGAMGATEIADSNPADGSELEALPESFEIWSSEVLDPALTQIIVVAPNGARIDNGSLVVDPDDPTHISTAIGSGGRAGHYTVHLLNGEPNTAREGSDSISFDLPADSGCDVEEEDSIAAGCLEALPEIELGAGLILDGGEVATVIVSSENAGPVDIEVSLKDPDGVPIETARVWVRSAHLEMDHGEFPHEAVLSDDGTYLANYVGMGMAGNWRIAVDVILEPGGTPMTIAVPVEMDSPG